MVEKCLINFEKPAKNEVREQLDGEQLVNIEELVRGVAMGKQVAVNTYGPTCCDTNQIISARKGSILRDVRKSMQ